MRKFVAAAILCAAALAVSGCEFGAGTSIFGSGYHPALGFSGGAGGTINGQISGGVEWLNGCGGSPDTGAMGFVTFTDSKGSVTESECWNPFSVSDSGISGFGRYTVTGGTGTYQGATGSGTSILVVNFTAPVGFTLTEFGTFNLPGTARTASARAKRTFNVHIKGITVPCKHGRRCTVKHPASLIGRFLDQVARR